MIPEGGCMQDDDLDSMIENPFRHLKQREEFTAPEPNPGRRNLTRAAETPVPSPASIPAAETRTEQNHPLELRVLALEKNELITAKKLDDIKRIIEHQNERIRLLEEELELLRQTPGREGA